jgi:hypothetical protein
MWTLFFVLWVLATLGCLLGAAIQSAFPNPTGDNAGLRYALVCAVIAVGHGYMAFR